MRIRFLAGSSVTLLIGDLAFMHDLSALPTLCKSGAPLVTVILNNGGGGIFQMLPIASHSHVFSPYFDTPHEHTFGDVCRGFGLHYASVSSREEFEASYTAALQRGAPSFIEVATRQDALLPLQQQLQ